MGKRHRKHPIWTPEKAESSQKRTLRFVIYALLLLVSFFAIFGRRVPPLLIGIEILTVPALILVLIVGNIRRSLLWRLDPGRVWTRTSFGYVLAFLGIVPLGLLIALDFFYIAYFGHRISYALGGLFLTGASFYELYLNRGILSRCTGFELILTPERVQFRTVDGREHVFLWTETPRLTHLDVRNLHIRRANTLPELVPRTLMPLLPTELRDILDYYSSHPDHRAELATEAGLIRVLDFCKNPG